MPDQAGFRLQTPRRDDKHDEVFRFEIHREEIPLQFIIAYNYLKKRPLEYSGYIFGLARRKLVRALKRLS